MLDAWQPANLPDEHGVWVVDFPFDSLAGFLAGAATAWQAVLYKNVRPAGAC